MQPGPLPISSGRDRKVDAERAALQRALLRQPEVQVRLRELQELDHPPLETLSTELEGAFSADELFRLIYPAGAGSVRSKTDSSRRVPLLNTGLQRVVGRAGNEKYRDQATIELVARSLALRTTGKSPTQADKRAATEYIKKYKILGDAEKLKKLSSQTIVAYSARVERLAQTIAVYRKKLRDDARR